MSSLRLGKNTPVANDVCKDYVTFARFRKITKTVAEEFDKVAESMMIGSLLRIYINSKGGDALAGFYIHESLAKAREGGVITQGVVKSECGSIAILVLQGCETRGVYESSELCFHPISGSMPKWSTLSDGTFNREAILDCMDEAESGVSVLRDKMYEILARRSVLSARQVGVLCENNATLTAKEALDLGFVDKIINV